MTRPASIPFWDNNDTNTTAPPNAQIDDGVTVGDEFPAQWLNYQFRAYGKWIEYLDSLAAGIFGDGSDGAGSANGGALAGCTLAGSVYTATRDLFFSSLTVATGKTIKMAGFRLYVSGALTLAGTARISCDGENASGQTPGATTGTLLSAAAGAGGSGGGAGAGGSAGSNTTNSFGGRGGIGGAGQGGAPGAAGTVTAPAATDGSPRLLQSLSTGFLFGVNGTTIIQGGAGGGGGGGAAAVNAGGGGGGPGGVLVVMARVMDLSNGCLLSAEGGAGGNGAGQAAGGGGGGGGVVLIGYRSLATGSPSPASQVSIAGGVAGTGGQGAPANGISGSAVIQVI